MLIRVFRSLALLLLAASARGVVVNEFVLPPAAGHPAAISRGPDGTVWFTSIAGNSINRLSVGGDVLTFPLPIPNSAPDALTLGDGNLWLGMGGTGAIGRMTTSGVVTTFPIPGGGAVAMGLTAGPDGNVWFTYESGSGGGLGRVSPAGTFSMFPLSPPARGVFGITSGPDGNLWFTEAGAGNAIGKISVAGAITEYRLPAPGSLPFGITAGPDGNVWFTENGTNRIGRITSGGQITEFGVPEPDAGPRSITAGPDGALWFTLVDRNRIGRISVEGDVSSYRVPTPAAGRGGIVSPGDSLWFTEFSGNRIGRVAVSGCAPDSATLCWQEGRFSARLSWTNPADGRTSPGTALPLTRDSGAFWFLTVNNLEVVVKLLDGRSFNDHFWIFIGGLTDLPYTLTVTDTQTGLVRIYSYAPGHIGSTADVADFEGTPRVPIDPLAR